MSDSVTPWTATCQTPVSSTISQSLLKLMSIRLVMVSRHPILCHLHLLFPSVFPSIRVFSNGLASLIRQPKNYRSFSFSISPFNEYSGLISFRIDWFDLAVQGTLKSILKYHSSEASIFGTHLFHGPILTSVHDYRKNIVLTIQIFVSKVMSLLFNTVYHGFPSNDKVSFNFMAVVTVCSDLGAQENKICHHFHFFPLYVL